MHEKSSQAKANHAAGQSASRISISSFALHHAQRPNRPFVIARIALAVASGCPSNATSGSSGCPCRMNYQLLFGERQTGALGRSALRLDAESREAQGRDKGAECLCLAHLTGTKQDH
ncbi:uncharacterized protein SPSK_10013 [Sporothrix schenckii 1099-18]|uniref:Uncharacterized protein n=1 Tax=Sporothrix schenckii 1099-18 TaxID=1397361 RepID=A0A0F2M6I7_SPOSC|nr:uncharacterized protein SPSK_10013 [Sporothrix schenckii 1099-18]KJR85308.1 hypothetical protein SPSK_10013 [Sporothrix schenckii 1099-18]